jgi:FkbM family methyltransferase
MNPIRTVLRQVAWVRRHPIAGRTPVASVLRVWRRQFSARVDGARVVPFVGGLRLRIGPGRSVANACHDGGLSAPIEMAAVTHLLREGELFVDIGANLGAFTLLAAGIAKARVLAIEPAPETLPWLHEHVALNNLTGLVEVAATALSDGPGEIRMTAGLGASNRVDPDGIAVPVTTLDALLAGRVPKLIKLDVEGHEAPVLRGAVATLAHPALLCLVVETRGHGDENAVDAQCRAAGLAPHAYDPFARRFTKLVAPQFGDTFYLRDAAEAGRRATAAPPLNVRGVKL